MASTRPATVVTRTSILPASPAQVFEAVNSPQIAPLIDPAVRTWQPDTEPVVVGTRFTIRGRLGLLPIRGASEVELWEPPHRAVFRSVRPTWPLGMTAEHRFEPHADGQTRYSWTITFHPVSVLGRPVIAVGARLFRRAMERQAVALTAYLAKHA